MKKKSEETWESYFSSFKPVYEKGNLVSATGKYRYNSCDYKVSLHRQKTGNYLYRGTVRVISKTGKMMKKKRKRDYEIEPDLGPLFGSPKPEYKTLSKMFYTNATDLKEVKECIENCVIKLYSENANLINSGLSGSMRPDIITPAVAADTKCERYVALSHKNASPETQHTIVLRIKRICAKLPNKPMASFRKTSLTEWLNELKAGRDTRKDLAGFWNYCCELGICEGSCPVEVPPLRRKSSKAKQMGVKRFDMLTAEQQDIFYANARKRIGSVEVGKVLMLGGGLKPKDIERLVWGDITFHEEYDFVTVKVIAERLSGATHNYSRPIDPQAAEIVHKRFDNLKEKYGITKLLQMPVVSTNTNPEKKMSASALIQNATRTLQELFNVSYASLALLRDENPEIAAASKVFSNSYIENLYSRCNLEADTGTATFLQAKSFGADPSNDNYISYTDRYGERRLYYILQILAEDKKLKKIPDSVGYNGEFIRTYTPDSKRRGLNISCDIYLQPGEEITIECLHGVEGVVTAYQTGDGGRRKKVTDQLEMTLF